MRFALLLIILLVISTKTFARESNGVDLFVAPNGSDKNPGNKLKPFATIERARDEIRTHQSAGSLPNGATVWVRGGIYTIEKTVNFTSEDGGIKEAPITYRAFPNETPRFLGGRKVGGWKPVTDSQILSRLDESARGKVYQTDLKAQGITDFGKLSTRGFSRPMYPSALELFFNKKPMQLAQWPNDGWDIITGAPAGVDGGKFAYEGDRPKRWAKSDDIWVHGYWSWAWAESYEKVKSIDAQAREIATEPPHGVYGYSVGKRYRVLNVLEELDKPGEYYLDRNTGILYFYPPEPIKDGETIVSIIEDPMVKIDHCSYVTLQGLTFEACRGSVVEMIGGSHNLIAGCTFRNIGNVAVWISPILPTINTVYYTDTTLAPDCGTDNGIVGCDIYHVGDCGIVVGGGDRKTLKPANNYAVNNHIYDCSRWTKTYRPAIMLNGVGNRAAHNLIHDLPHTAILILAGNENIVEYNDIHTVCLETGDAGAFYIGRDWSMRGNIVRYNYFHDLGGFDDKFSAHKFSDTMGVYLDDWASGTSIYGNVFYKSNRAILIGSGRDNIVDNNIFVDCKPCVHVDIRGKGWAKFYFENNDGILFHRIRVINHDQPPYSVRYPELANILSDEPVMPKGNKIIRNIRSGSGKWLDLIDGVNDKIIEIKDNIIEGDPGFVAPEEQDFRLKENSPALKLGFKQIPVEKIGLYKDEYRKKLPGK